MLIYDRNQRYYKFQHLEGSQGLDRESTHSCKYKLRKVTLDNLLQYYIKIRETLTVIIIIYMRSFFMANLYFFESRLKLKQKQENHNLQLHI